METTACIKTRRSIRRFKEEPLPRTVIEEILEISRYAPSWKNTQIARYRIVEEKKTIQRLADNCVMGFEWNGNIMKRAAALVLLTIIDGRSGFEKDGAYSTSKGDGWEMFDAGIAAQTFCLAANDRGIGTVILGVYDEQKVNEEVDLPEGEKMGAIIAIGYPAEEPKAPKRKSVEDLVRYL